jgi:DNA mismatch repair protein MutS2
MIDTRVLEELELPAVLALAAAQTRTEGGRRRLLESAPQTDLGQIRRALAEADEAERRRATRGRLPIAGLRDARALLELLRRGGGLETYQTYRAIVAILRAAERIRGELARDKDYPALALRAARLPDLSRLLGEAGRLFAADGSLRDDASAKLAELRHRLRRRHQEIAERLKRLIESHREFVGEAIVVQRNDRYCIPVKSSAQGRISGIIHDRSASRATVYVEPMEVVEANNELSLASAEEKREAARLLRAFGSELLSEQDAIDAAADEIAALDAAEARALFGAAVEGAIPEIEDGGPIRLLAARHPLLDPRLAPLRREVLGEDRFPHEVVPLTLELDPSERLLVISGPNAGGKTVVLKTVGLFVLLAQCGFPLPAAPGTRLPRIATIITSIGDSQQILSDLSTFSSAARRLAQALTEASRESLVLLDEIGSATDPEEGTALAVAFLEQFLALGGQAVVTTHLSGVKAFAEGRPDAVPAAMEFDEQTGHATYRIVRGLSGSSRALDVAAEQGLPEEVLGRARALLGEGWIRRQKSEREAEEILARLRQLEADLARDRSAAAEQRRSLEQEAENAEAARRQMLEVGRQSFERARQKMRQEVASELARLRQDASLAARTNASEVMRRAEEAAAPPLLEEAREIFSRDSGALAVGQSVRIRSLESSGRILELSEKDALLDVRGKKLRIGREELAALAEPARPHPVTVVRALNTETVATEVHLLGMTLEDAIAQAEKAIDGALLSGLSSLRLIHGHGTGRLRKGLRDHFRGHPAVASLRSGDPREGGTGVTILELE